MQSRVAWLRGTQPCLTAKSLNREPRRVHRLVRMGIHASGRVAAGAVVREVRPPFAAHDGLGSATLAVVWRTARPVDRHSLHRGLGQAAGRDLYSQREKNSLQSPVPWGKSWLLPLELRGLRMDWLCSKWPETVSTMTAFTGFPALQAVHCNFAYFPLALWLASGWNLSGVAVSPPLEARVVSKP